MMIHRRGHTSGLLRFVQINILMNCLFSIRELHDFRRTCQRLDFPVLAQHAEVHFVGIYGWVEAQRLKIMSIWRQSTDALVWSGSGSCLLWPSKQEPSILPNCKVLYQTLSNREKRSNRNERRYRKQRNSRKLRNNRGRKQRSNRKQRNILHVFVFFGQARGSSLCCRFFF